MNVARPAQREPDHACANGGVGHAVDQDERPGRVVGFVGIERHGGRQCEIAEGNLVQLQRLAGNMLKGVDVDLVLDLRNGRRHGAVCRSSEDRADRAASGSSDIQMTWAANWSATSGRCAVDDRRSPREMSISSSSVMVTASPARAADTSPPAPMIDFTLEILPVRRQQARHRRHTLPLATVPE